jgi:hypothetical protein
MPALAPPPAVIAQQTPNADGLAFFAEAGTGGRPSLVSLLSAHAMRRVDVRVVEGARVPAVARRAGQKAGTLTLDSVDEPIALTIGARTRAGTITLARRGALRVTFAPRAKTVLSVTGLPARTRRLELTLSGGKGRLLTAQGCEGEQNFAVTVERADGGRPLRAAAGVTC